MPAHPESKGHDLMKLGIPIILSALVLFPSSYLCAAPPDIERLEADRARLESIRDSLLSRHSQSVTLAEALAVQIDSLKSARGPASAGLREKLQRSLELAGRLEALDRGLDGVGAELGKVLTALRQAYDREISRLIALVGQTQDQAVMQQLMACERARGNLGLDSGPERAGSGVERLRIRPEDGPDEIRQKVQLLEDTAARLRVEASAVQLRLKDLRTERRLRSRMAAFVREAGLFEEVLPEGRALSAGEQKAAPVTPPGDQRGLVGVSGAPETKGETGETGGGTLVSGTQIAREKTPASDDALSAEDLEAEIRVLEARQKDLQGRERELLDRARSFQGQLKGMLEGAD